MKAIGRDCEFFTMLRDPIERLVSAFYNCPTDNGTQDMPSKVNIEALFGIISARH